MALMPMRPTFFQVGVRRDSADERAEQQRRDDGCG